MVLPFFYEQIHTTNAQFLLSEETSKHCIQVLRMKVGEQLNITNGQGNVFTATIIDANKKNCWVTINQSNFQSPSIRKIVIAISLIKNTNRLEWFLEKATEIGVTEIVPLICTRTEKQYFRFDRMNNILIAAMLQSEQAWLPKLHQPINFETYIQQSNISSQKFIAHCIADDKKELKTFLLQNEIEILIGPEGDFSAHEISTALKNNYQPVSLGNTRLRTETAGIVAATILRNF